MHLARLVISRENSIHHIQQELEKKERRRLEAGQRKQIGQQQPETRWDDRQDDGGI